MVGCASNPASVSTPRPGRCAVSGSVLATAARRPEAGSTGRPDHVIDPRVSLFPGLPYLRLTRPNRH